jgi:signal transduction histidine kinase
VEEERLRTARLAFLESLAAGIAHEIKNPLVALRTFAQLLPRRLHDERFHGEFCRIAVKEIDRIDGLLGRLRELARRPEQQCEPVELRRPIDEMLSLLRARLEERTITVECHYGCRPFAVLGDSNLLKQLFLNVFVNALDAMPAGGRLKVALTAKQTVGDSLLVAEVTDTGEGIPEELIPRVFNPFVSTKPGGSGLGLSICRSIADAHRARIRIHNNPSGGGVTVGIEFPLLSDRVDGRAQEVGPRDVGALEEAPHEVNRGSRHRVLKSVTRPV